MNPKTLYWLDCGDGVAFVDALHLQRETRAGLLKSAERGTLRGTIQVFTCSHPPTMTLGYRAAQGQQDLLVSPEELQRRGIALVACERGGRATFHGPGQLMIYPVLSLPAHSLGVRDYVWLLEEVTLNLLRDLGILNARRGDAQAGAGLYVAKGKIASIGIHVERGACIQGLALNLWPDPEFSLLHPCGRAQNMTSVAEELADRGGLSLPRSLLAERWVKGLSEALQIPVKKAPNGSLPQLTVSASPC